MKVKTLVLLIILMHITGLLFAQEAKIVWDRIKGTQFKKAIEFIDNNNKIIKSIDLTNENPYNHLDYEIEMINDAGHNSYKNIPYDDLFTDKSDFDPDKVKKIEYVYGSSNVNVHKMEEFVLVLYSIGTRFGDIFSGSLTTMKIYSLNGTIIKDYENLMNIGSVRLTENAKYMLYSYGNDMGDESVIKEKMGVRIYDIENNELLIDRRFDNGFLPNNHYAKGNLLVISSTIYEKEKVDKLEIVNFKDRKIYTKIMPRPEHIRLKKITEEGFILRNSDITKDDVQLFYVNDFIMEDF